MDLQQAKNMYQMYKQRYDDIIKRYGTGVRPSWVSTDLAIEGERMRHYAKIVEGLEDNANV